MKHDRFSRETFTQRSQRRFLGLAARAKWKWVAILMAVGLAAIGARVWSQGQSANSKAQAQNPPLPQRPEDQEPPMTPERELARSAILDPVAFEKLARKVKTPNELQDEDIAKFAISQPKAYAAEFEKFKTAERRGLEQQARAAILDPVAHSGPPRKKAKIPQSPATPKP